MIIALIFLIFLLLARVLLVKAIYAHIWYMLRYHVLIKRYINDPLQRRSNLNCISLARNWVKSHVTQSFKLKTPLAQHLAHHHLVTLASQQFFQPKNPKHIQRPAYHAPTQPNPTVHITQPINPSSNNSPGFRTHHDFDFESVETNGDRLVHQLRYLDLWNKIITSNPWVFAWVFDRFGRFFGRQIKMIFLALRRSPLGSPLD